MTPSKLHWALDILLIGLVCALALQVQRDRTSLTESRRSETTLQSKLEESVSALTLTQTQTDVTRTTTTTQKPDGTRVVEVKVETKKATEAEQKQTDTQVQTQTRTQTTESSFTKTALPSLSRYSLELLWNPKQLSYVPSVALVGARLGDLPLWAEAGYLPPSKSFTLGLRLEF